MIIGRVLGVGARAGRVGAVLGSPASVAGNGLRTALIAFWPGNEVSGDALDLHTNALHLTGYNGVGNASGLVYPLARAYSSPSLQYHARPGDDELLSITGDFTIAVWTYISAGQSMFPVASKERVGSTSREYAMFYISTGSYFQFFVYYNGTTSAVAVNNTSAPVGSGWALVIADYNATTGQISIQTNNGATDTAAFANTPTNGTAAFAIGRRATAYATGIIGPTMIWKSVAGGGGCLSSSQRTALWNAGAGLPYAAFTV